MWTTGTSLMIARLAGSTLYANHNVASLFTFDQRSASTSTTTTTATGSSNVITKMRDLRARNPYALFMKDNYSEISAKNPNLKLTDVSKKVAEAWKSLSDEKKQSYTKKFEEQKVHYEEEKKRLSADDLQSVDADEKAKRIQNRVKSMQQIPTKRPRSAYAHFLTTLDRGEADIGSFVKGAAQRWAQMSTQDKQKFEDLHQEEKEKYTKALVAWASANEKQTKPATARRSKSASASTQATDTPVRKTRAKSATGTHTVKKRAAAGTTKKSTKSKSTQTSSDKEGSSSSSSDDESTVKARKPTAQKKS